MEALKWENCKIRLGDLIPWDRNPRKINERQRKRLAQSFEEFGQVEPFAIGPGGEVWDGHQRLSTLLSIHGEDFEVDARRSNRALTNAEREKLVIFLHSGAAGSWDWDQLAQWDAEELQGWGFDKEAVGEIKEDLQNIKDLVKNGRIGPPDDPTEGLIPEGSRYKEQYGVIIICKNEAEQEEVYNNLTGQGYDCKVVVT